MVQSGRIRPPIARYVQRALTALARLVGLAAERQHKPLQIKIQTLGRKRGRKPRGYGSDFYLGLPKRILSPMIGPQTLIPLSSYFGSDK